MAESEAHAHPSNTTYYGVFAALLVMTLVNIGISFVDLQGWNLWVNLSIAAVQAILLTQFFMHLRDGDPMNQLIAAAGLFWLAIMFVLMLTDYFTREHGVL